MQNKKKLKNHTRIDSGCLPRIFSFIIQYSVVVKWSSLNEVENAMKTPLGEMERENCWETCTEDALIKVKMLPEVTKLYRGYHSTLSFMIILTCLLRSILKQRMFAAPQNKYREFLELCGENSPGYFDKIITEGSLLWSREQKGVHVVEKKGAGPPKKFKVDPLAGKFIHSLGLEGNFIDGIYKNRYYCRILSKYFS